jgi:hypothetical protein
MSGRKKGVKNGTKVTVPMILRMRQLRNVGLSVEAISRVISLDWEVLVTKEQVRYQCPAIRPGWHGGAAAGIAGLAHDNSANLLRNPGKAA